MRARVAGEARLRLGARSADPAAGFLWVGREPSGCFNSLPSLWLFAAFYYQEAPVPAAERAT